MPAGRIRNRLAAKAAALTSDYEGLRYIVCSREQVSNRDPELLTVTAADIFGP